MSKHLYKIKAAFFCNKNLSNSLEELKSFLGFELNKINLQEQSNLINRENQVMIVDNSFSEFTLLDKINIPKVLIIDKYTKNNFKQVSNIMERLKKLIFNNISYNNGATWFDAKIQSVQYERDDEDQSLIRGIANFNCQNIEVV